MVQNTTLRERMLNSFIYEPHTGSLKWRLNRREAGYREPDGYISVRFEGKLYQAHRVIWYMIHEEWPELIDHINRDKQDNRFCNLRLADKRVNAINTGIPSNNTSGIKGVSWHKAGKCWTAQIKDKGRKIHLGSYKLLEDAIEARQQAEEELWGEFRATQIFIS